MKATAALLAIAALAMPKVQTDSSLTKAAKAFLDSLSRDQHRAALLPITSPDRMAWTYVPGTRKGVAWGEMTDAQKAAGRELLRVSLSKEGFEKIESIRALEPVLAAMEGGNKERDPERYWFMFFGTPGADSPWLWRYEGHHVSLTFASNGNVVVSSTPQFLGSNPAQVKTTGLRVLAKEEDLGFQLVESLTPDQRLKAILSDQAPTDIVTASSRKAYIDGHLGIPYSSLNETQKKHLRELIHLHASVQTKAEQSRRLAAIEKEGYSNIVFAWLGPVKHDTRHYYRIQGSGFIIEYDNTQADGNHIHTVWRDFKGDFGGDALAEHYQQAHSHDH